MKKKQIRKDLPTSRITLRLPEKTVAEIDRRAKQLVMTRNMYIRFLLQQVLEK